MISWYNKLKCPTHATVSDRLTLFSRISLSSTFWFYIAKTGKQTAEHNFPSASGFQYFSCKVWCDRSKPSETLIKLLLGSRQCFPQERLMVGSTLSRSHLSCYFYFACSSIIYSSVSRVILSFVFLFNLNNTKPMRITACLILWVIPSSFSVFKPLLV